MPVRETLEIVGVNKTQAAFNQVQRSIGGIQKNTGRLANSFGSLQRTILGFAAALGGIQVGKNIIDITARFEDLRTTLTSVTGSVQGGAEAFDFISKFATKTQFGVEELTQTFIKLKASGIEPTEKLLTTFTDTAAVTTDQIGSLTAITDLLSRTTSGGLGLEELNRLADRGIPVFKILEERLGLTRLQISEFGKTSEGAEKITQALLSGLDDAFGGATQARVENLSTQISNLGIALTNSADVMGQQFSVALGFGIAEVTRFIETNEDFIRRVGDSIVDISRSALIGGARFLDALKPVFEFVKQGINGLIRFVNQLPPEFQVLGMIGFFLVGRGVKLVLLAVAALFDEIKGAVDSAIKFFERQINKLVDAYNYVADFFGANPLDKVIFGDGAFSSMVDEVNKKFVDFVGNATGELREVAFEITGLDPETIGENEKRVLAFIGKMDKAIENSKKKQQAQGPLVQTAVTQAQPAKPEITDKEKEQLLKKVEQFEDSLLTQTEMLKKEHANRISIIEKALEDEVIAEQRAIELKRALNDKFQKEHTKLVQQEAEKRRLAEFRAKGLSEQQAQDLNKQIELFEKDKGEFIRTNTKNILRDVGTFNKKAFEAYKAYSIAEALISTAKGAAAAIGSGLPPPFNFIAAAAVVAAGMAQVNAIRSQTYGGRQEGGPVTGGSPFLVGEAGPEVFKPRTNGEIIPMDKLGGSEPVTVNFNINTVDARGFDELLTQRRGLIVNMVNDAVTNRGREAIV